MLRALVVSVGFMVAGTLVGAVCAEAQSQQDADQASAPHGATSSGATSSGAAGSGAAAKPKSKKVWTNEDMGDVTGTISVVGTEQPRATTTRSKISSLQSEAPSGSNGKQGTTPKSGDEVDPKLLAQLKQEVQKLQSSIDQLDKQIEQLKGLSRGDSKNTGGLNADTWSYSTATIPDQIKTLESKRSALQTSLDNLMDAAREHGIEPGQLR
jgi:hypothetical protein